MHTLETLFPMTWPTISFSPRAPPEAFLEGTKIKSAARPVSMRQDLSWPSPPKKESNSSLSQTASLGGNSLFLLYV